MTDDLRPELWRLEQRLFESWVCGQAFRERWTPNPSDYDTLKHAAIAQACATLAAEGVEGEPGRNGARSGNLETAMRRVIVRTPELRVLWPDNEHPLHGGVECSDPDAELLRWRELRCLIALRRSLVAALSSITPATPLDSVRRAILEASSKTYVSGAMATLTLAEWRQAGAAAMMGDPTRGAPCGFSSLDRETGGLRAGTIWVLGAPTNWGKSSWLLAVADHCASVGRPCLLVTCEDDPTMLATRHVCRAAGVRGANARHGNLTPEEHHAVARLLSETSTQGHPVIADGRGKPVEVICQELQRLHAMNPIGVVLIDYLQCITTSTKTDDRRGQINHIARSLTDTIKGMGAAGVLASQLTGDDIRESRDVEHAAEVVLIGRKDGGRMALFVKKNKSGPNDQEIELTWDPVTGSFATGDGYESMFD